MIIILAACLIPPAVLLITAIGVMRKEIKEQRNRLHVL
jgi:hypothetical protein